MSPLLAALLLAAPAPTLARWQAPVLPDSTEAPAGDLDPGGLGQDVAPAGGPSTVPEGSIPDAPAPSLATGERYPRWSWLQDPLSPTRGASRRRQNPHRFLPLPSVRSQPGVGLMLGGTVQYAFRANNDAPNRVYMIFESRASLRRVQEHGMFIRLRDLLGRQEIFEIGAGGRLDPVFPYFGVANNHNLDGLDLLDRYYTTRIITAGGFLNYQHPLWRLPASRDGPAGVLRSYTGFAYHVDQVTPYEGSLLLAERPVANLDARRGIIRLGLTWDRRDNEWSPGRGALFDVIVDNAGPWTGSSDAWGRVSGNFRNYWTLGIDKLVLAHRITFDALWGDAPLVALGEIGGLTPSDALGGASTGRGWMRRRYIGRLKAFGTLELRFEPVEFKVRRHTLGIGLKGFVDLGMVAQRMMDLPKHWHVSGGTGLSMIWDRFAVLRLDAGFSRESFGLYFISEHSF